VKHADRASSLAAEASEVEAAAERLLNGTALRSSGRRLSVVALAEEAGMKRTRLYELHREQVDAFLAQAGRIPAGPSMQALQAQLEEARAKIAELEAENAAQQGRIRTLLALVSEISLQADGSTNVMPMRTGRS
jgi:hypothetical protein